MKTCLVVGSLNMDYTLYLSRFPIDGETIFGKKRYIQPGGKGANQAAALGKSSLVNSIMLGGVGNDNDGLTIKDIINKCHVNSAIITKTNVETGNATIVVNDNSENKIVIIAGANGELNIGDIDLSLIDKSDYIILQNEIKQEVNEFVINEAYKRHKIIIYNPAPYREIEDKTLLKVDYFIPNEVELSLYSNSNNVMDGVDYLLSKGVNKTQIISINFEDADFEDLTDYKKLYEYLKLKLLKNKMTYIFLDEIQNVKDFQKAVDSLYIKDNVDIYITGSNAYLLSGELATLLSGRYVQINRLPLSFKEYSSAINNNSLISIEKVFSNYLSDGGFPYILNLPDESTKKDYLEGIYNTIVVKDIMARNKISESSILQSVIKFIFDNIGNTTSAKKN